MRHEDFNMTHHGMYECIGRIGKRDCELGTEFLRNLILRIRANEILVFEKI